MEVVDPVEWILNNHPEWLDERLFEIAFRLWVEANSQMAVASTGLNFRAGPSTQDIILGSVTSVTEVIAFGRNNPLGAPSWLLVLTPDHRIGWVYNRYLNHPDNDWTVALPVMRVLLPTPEWTISMQVRGAGVSGDEADFRLGVQALFASSEIDRQVLTAFVETNCSVHRGNHAEERICELAWQVHLDFRRDCPVGDLTCAPDDHVRQAFYDIQVWAWQ